MDEIRIPVSLTIAIALPPPGRPSRDGPIRHPSHGWSPPGTRDSPVTNPTPEIDQTTAFAIVA